MQARQATVDQTRLRITEAAVQLHEEVGPAATTTSAVAERAGVTRLTVYRHFPDADSLFAACSAHWRDQHPRPDIQGWRTVEDPEERVLTALRQTCRWARTAASMTSRVLADLDQLPEFIAAAIREDEWQRVRALTEGFGLRGRAARRTEAAVAHALDVRTWQSLCEQRGLREEEFVQLMAGLVVSAATSSITPTRRGRTEPRAPA